VQPVHAQELGCEVTDDPALHRQAEQKIVLLERLSGDTDPVRRVLESGDPNATGLLEAARDSVALARESLDAGCAKNASDLAATGLGQASQAFQLVRKQNVGLEREYRALQRRTTGFLEVLESQNAGVQGITADDLAGIRRQLDRAELMAIDGDYDDASALLRPVADRLQRRLLAIFDQQTIYYERDFAGPADEYAYIVEQYNGYRLLLQQLADERPLPFSSRENYESALRDATTLSEQAARLAAENDWEKSLAAMREALNKCEQALRLTGISY
jgi:hypothetical protein